MISVNNPRDAKRRRITRLLRTIGGFFLGLATAWVVCAFAGMAYEAAMPYLIGGSLLGAVIGFASPVAPTDKFK